jgi:peptidoglycan/LPS O-acetylase OafA/YrhL
MTRSRTFSGHTFRPDVEGLRGVAVLLVVLFHAELLGVGGGFIGVDVFFVISGFLITGLLLRERLATGRIGLTAFYARRIRRLLPAAAVLLAVTIPVVYLVLDPLSRGEALLDAAASALSVANIRFAITTGDYFAPTLAPSPFLHFWSLAVEEQFYLVWPALLLLATRGGRPRLAAGLALTGVLVASLAASVLLTETAVSWAFYSLPTRAWQLALGGLLAIGATSLGRLPGLPLAAAGWVGLGMVLAAAFGLDAGTAYPGTAALLPTVGAAAMLLGGERRFGPGALLSTRPLRFLGRISYSLYLWHWPLLVLPAAVAIDGTLPLAVRVSLVAAAVVVSTASCLFVEEPFRHGIRPLARLGLPFPPRATVTAGTAVILSLAIVAGGLADRSTRELDGLAAGGPPITDEDPWESEGGGTDILDPVAGEEPSPDALPEPTTTPGNTPSDRPGDIPTDRPAPATPQPTAPPTINAPAPSIVASGPGLPADLRPALSQARNDAERLAADRCLAYEAAKAPPECSYGPRNAAFTVALVGDSHAAHWFPALEAISKQRGWKIVPMVKVSCPFMDVAVHSRVLKREYTECTAFREAVLDRLGTLRPDLTIVVNSKWVTPVNPDDKKASVLGAALGRLLKRVPGRAVVLYDTPHAGQDVPTCLAENPTNIAKCATPRARAMGGVGVIEAIGAERAGVPTINLAKAVCPASPCPAIVNSMIVYRDHHHLTATFARSLGPALDRAIRKLGS